MNASYCSSIDIEEPLAGLSLGAIVATGSSEEAIR
jgi:hypothetical protein